MYIRWSNNCWHAQHTLVVFVSFQRVVAFTQEFIPPLQVKLKQKFPVVITGGSMGGITVMAVGQVEMGDRWQVCELDTCYILFCILYIGIYATYVHSCMHARTHTDTRTHTQTHAHTRAWCSMPLTTFHHTHTYVRNRVQLIRCVYVNTKWVKED